MFGVSDIVFVKIVIGILWFKLSGIFIKFGCNFLVGLSIKRVICKLVVIILYNIKSKYLNVNFGLIIRGCGLWNGKVIYGIVIVKKVVNSRCFGDMLLLSNN